MEVDETLGQLLVAEGFSTIDEIHKSSSEEISKIEGIDENTAQELKKRSEEYLIKEKENIGKKLKDLGVDESLINQIIVTHKKINDARTNVTIMWLVTVKE